MVDTYHFPADLYPDVQNLTPEVPGQELGEGEFNGAQSVTTFVGYERWKLNLTLSDLVGDDRADVSAFVTKLRVSRNVFLCVNHTAPQRGALNGTPLVISGSGGSQVLVVGNLANNVSSYARSGDFVSVNCELKMVLENVGTSGSGVASLSVWPPMRASANSGTFVVVNSPCGAFRMIRSTILNTTPPGYRTSTVIEAVERINSAQVVDL